MTTPKATAPTLAEFTSPAFIFPQLQGRTPVEVIREMAAILQPAEGLEGVFRPGLKALTKELLTSTGLKAGLVCAEVKLSTVKRLQFALGRCPTPLPWLVRTYPPIEFVVLLLSSPALPEVAAVRAALTTLGRDTAKLQRLRTAADANEMLDVLASCLIVVPSPLPSRTIVTNAGPQALPAVRPLTTLDRVAIQ